MKNKNELTTTEIVAIARHQKVLIWIAAAWIVAGFMPGTIVNPLVSLLAWIVTQFIGIIVCCELARVMGKNVPLWTFLTIAPFVNVFAYGRMFSEASKVLKSNGIPTGTFGVSKSDIERLATGK